MFDTLSRYKDSPSYKLVNKCLLFVLFVIYPIAALPIVVYGVFHRKKYCFTYLAAYMGVFAVLYPPYGDVYRYTLDYLIYKNLDFYSFSLLSGLKFDFLLPYLAYGMGKLDLNFDLYRFIYSFVGYQLVFNIFNDLVNKNLSLQRKQTYRLFLILYFVLFALTSFSFRFGLSTILYVYAVYKLIYCRNNIGWIYLVAAVLNHFSFGVFFILFLGVKIRLFERSKKFLILCIFIALFMDDGLFVGNLLKMLPLQDGLMNHIMEYINGNADQGLLEGRPWTAKIGTLIGAIAIYPVMYYAVKFYRRDLSFSVIIQMFVLLACTAPFFVVYYRYVQLTIVLFVVYFSYRYTHTSVNYKCLKVLMTFCLLSFLFHFYTIRKVLYVSAEYKWLYASFPALMSHTYTEQWLYQNVSEEGDLLPALF